MPRLSRWAIKIGLVHFALGLVLGAMMLAAKAGYGSVELLNHRLVHVHMLLFGWLVQLVIGVGYWLFPTFLEGPKRGTPRLAAAALVTLNVGVILGTAEPWVVSIGAAGWTLESLAVVMFAAHGWPRIKAGRQG